MSWTVALLTLGLVARITRLITTDHIAGGLRARLIGRYSPDRGLGFAISCPWCLSVWFAALVVPAAWWWGEHPAYQIVALIAAISYLVGTAATFVEGDGL